MLHVIRKEKKMRFCTKTIVVQALNEQRCRCEVEVEAHVASNGVLAYHRFLTESRSTGKKNIACGSTNTWTVTHLPTGCCINTLDGSEDRVKEWIVFLSSLSNWQEHLPTASQLEQAWETFCHPLTQLTLF